MKPEETGLATQIDEQLHCGCASPLPDAVYFAAVTIGAVLGAFGLFELWRVAILLHLLASLFIARELWRARHAAPASTAGASRPLGGLAGPSSPAFIPRTGASS